MIDDAIYDAVQGNAMLFCGSGFSFGAKDTNDNILPLGSQFSHELYDKLGFDREDWDDDLQYVSQKYSDKFGESTLIKKLSSRFTASSVCNWHIEVLGLDWHRVYTTNYDNICETASSEAKMIRRAINLVAPPGRVTNLRQSVIHLNGSVSGLTKDTLRNGFKLTRKDYLNTEFVRSKWAKQLRNDIISNRSAIFIGFSGEYDLDLTRIIGIKESRNQDNCHFVVSPDESDKSVDKLSMFGTVHRIGVQGFAERIVELNYKKTIDIEYELNNLKSFDRVRVPDELQYFESTNPTVELLFKGSFSPFHCWNDIINGKSDYTVFRDGVKTIREWIAGGQCNVVLHSDIGNGKSIFISELELYLTHNKYNVYRFVKYSDVVTKELELLSESVDNLVLIVEHYSRYFDILRDIQIYRKENTVLILSERSIINDTSGRRLEEIIGPSYFTLKLNRLKNSEITRFNRLLKTNGLWGEFSNLSEQELSKRIEYDYKASIRLTLLDAFKSEVISNKIRDLIDEIKNDKSTYEALLLIFACNMMNVNIDLDTLTFVLKNNTLYNSNFSTNDAVKEFIDFRRGEIVGRSPILAETVIKGIKEKREILDLLIKVAVELDESDLRSDREFLRQLVSFSNIQRFFETSRTNRNTKDVIEFFEKTKHLYHNRKSSYFWLQYAMAVTEDKQFEIAEQYFETAYSFAKNLYGEAKFNRTIQIDNHFARFTIEYAIHRDDEGSAITYFNKCHEINVRQLLQNSNSYFPFKVGKKYYDFFKAFYDRLSVQDRASFAQSWRKIYHSALKYRTDNSNMTIHKSVDDCISLFRKHENLF